MLHNYISLRQFWLIKWSYFNHSTTPYIHPRLDSRIEPKNPNGSFPYGICCKFIRCVRETITKGALAIRRMFSLVDMITKPKFSN